MTSFGGTDRHLTLEAAREWMGASIERNGEFASLGFVTHARPHMLVFVADERFVPAASQNRHISCALTTVALASTLPAKWGIAVAADPRRAFYAFHERLIHDSDFYGVSSPTVIAPSARVHPTAFLAAEDVRIGERVVLEPHVVVHPRVLIEDDAIVRAGTVLGSEGFQVQFVDGRVVRVPHGGAVRIGRRADVHANCCIDRGLFGETVVGVEATLDNLVYLAHDARLGARCRVGSGAVINGSTAIEDDVWIGPNATISSELTIGTGAQITLGSVVTRDVPAGERVSGNFAIPHARFLDHLRRVR